MAQEGPAALFKGLGAALLRAFPVCRREFYGSVGNFLLIIFFVGQRCWILGPRCRLGSAPQAVVSFLSTY